MRERPAGSPCPTHYVVFGGHNRCARVLFPGEHTKETAEFMVNAYNNAADEVEYNGDAVHLRQM